MNTSPQHAGLIEVSIVVMVLGGVALASGAHVTDLLSALAGLLTFMCTQVAFDMNEHLQSMKADNLHFRNRYRILFFMKECIWVVTFIVLGSLPLLASTGVFASYPYWRRKIRNCVAAAPRLCGEHSAC
jgi:hypothetical protein